MKTLLPRILTKEKDPDSYKAVEELDEILRKAKEEGIRNVALTGPYGSGGGAGACWDSMKDSKLVKKCSFLVKTHI